MEMRGRGKGSRIEFFNDLYNVSVYESSNSNAPNVRVGASGKFYRTTSSKRYKEDIQLADVDSGKILNLEPKSWYDKGEVERNNGSTEGLRRVYGLIAEDVEDAGLEEYVEYGEDGKVEGLKYERLLTLLIPETKKIRDENIRLQEEVGELKDKIKEIKENLMGGM